MKKSLIIITLFLLIMPLFNAASIDMKSEYDQGETIIAKVLASFPQGLKPENINFYRNGYVDVPFNYDVGKIGDFYYISADTQGVDKNNYTLVIEDAYYYLAGKAVNDDILANFTIGDGIADFSVTPGTILTTNGFSINLKSMADLSISVSITPPEIINSPSSVSLSPGEIEVVDFTFENPESDLINTISLSAGGTSYSVPLHIIGQAVSPSCGNGEIDIGEVCDGTEWGEITGCEYYGFDTGALSCREQNTYLECTFDTSGCYNESVIGEEPECGNNIMESGEQCDGTDWGFIKSCTHFGYDAGTLECVNCNFNKDDCYTNDECAEDRDCNNGYVCNSSNECEKSEIYCDNEDECLEDEICRRNICTFVECKEKEDCEENEICQNYECVNKKLQCLNNSHCGGVGECVDGFCVPIDRECTNNSGCDGDQICNDNYECVDNEEVECDKDKPCDKGEECLNNKCIKTETINLCDKYNGTICATNKVCDGDSSDIDGRTCCYGGGKCVSEGGSSTGKIIGWSLLGIIVLVLIYVYFKMKKTQKKNPDLKRIATAPVVKGNLFR